MTSGNEGHAIAFYLEERLGRCKLSFDVERCLSPSGWSLLGDVHPIELLGYASDNDEKQAPEDVLAERRVGCELALHSK
jgi:hypothetical protein